MVQGAVSDLQTAAYSRVRFLSNLLKTGSMYWPGRRLHMSHPMRYAPTTDIVYGGYVEGYCLF